MWCHLPLALPVLGLVLFFVLPLPIAAPLYGVVVLASVLMYRILLRALRLPVKTGPEGMVGGLAYVVEPLLPEGVVRYGGELWRAVGGEPVERGARVRIDRVEGMTVIVQAIINELFAAGAEAVAINGERFTVASAVQCVGTTVLLNGKRLAAPFRLEAIGDDAALEAFVTRPAGALRMLQAFGFPVAVSRARLVLPPYRGTFAPTALAAVP